MPAVFSNCKLIDLDTGRDVPVRDVVLTFPFPRGVPRVNGEVELYDIEIETITRAPENGDMGGGSPVPGFVRRSITSLD